MNKLERMTAVLLYLQERPRTAREIAEHFEVSRRTVLRDIQALSQMGVPIIAREGAGGGLALPADYSLAPLALSPREVFLLLLALQALRQPADVPFGRERSSLEAKLRSLLPPAHRQDAEKLLANVAFPSPPGERRSPFLDLLVAAIETGSWLRGVYHSAQRTSTQHLFPRQISLENGLWYLRAYSRERGEERTYRVDRFVSLSPSDEPLEPPEPAVERPYAAETDPLILAHLTRKGAARLDSDPHLSAWLQVHPEGSARLEFRFPPSELDWYAHFFAGLGADVTIEEPPELRLRLAEMGEKLVRRYAKR
jgi:predicted DNA-binding transcriptional regulator YafY